MKTRKARAKQITAHVPGWTDLKGNIFSLNSLAAINCKSLGISGSYLICGHNFRLDSESGYSTCINLSSSDAYVADPAAEVRLNSMFDLIRRDQEVTK